MAKNSNALLCHLLWIFLLLLQASRLEARRTTASLASLASYRLPATMGRSADVGSGRDLFKKFMLWRGLLPQEPPRENVIVIAPPSPTYTSFYTPTTTTTTTTTTTNNTRTAGRWRPRGRSEVLEDPGVPTMPTSLQEMLEPEDGGGGQRITKQSKRRRKRPSSDVRNRNGLRNGQKKKKQQKKKTRHRHIHKRQQRQLRREQTEPLAALPAIEEQAQDFRQGQQIVLATKHEQLLAPSQLKSILRRLQAH